jgi:hypothetical protein
VTCRIFRFELIDFLDDLDMLWGGIVSERRDPSVTKISILSQEDDTREVSGCAY